MLIDLELLRSIRPRRRKIKEQDAVGGARLTIEIGAEFPIGITFRRATLNNDPTRG